MLYLPGKVTAKKPSPTLDLGCDGFNATPPTSAMAGPQFHRQGEPLAEMVDVIPVAALESDAVSDLTPGIWSHIHLRGSKYLWSLGVSDVETIRTRLYAPGVRSETTSDSGHCTKRKVNWS
ncbi:hypothetical protein J6590_013734 [Homalodisca vitripennis]|nr:hypothetical protein J6590_013734 [Homalodisca vitripennis]